MYSADGSDRISTNWKKILNEISHILWSHSKMTTSNQTVWILKASVMDRSGALTSIASAFSNQGINLDAAAGFGGLEDSPNQGSVVMAFHGTVDQRDIMVRRIRRLQKVTQVQWIEDTREALKQALFDLATHLDSCSEGFI